MKANDTSEKKIDRQETDIAAKTGCAEARADGGSHADATPATDADRNGGGDAGRGKARSGDEGPSDLKPGTSPQDLTLFQQEILLVLAAKDGCSDYGLAIKRGLEELYNTEIYHGRLYPNLDDLVQLGLIEKGELDRRTNSYALTDAAKALLRQDAQRRSGLASRLNDDAHAASGGE